MKCSVLKLTIMSCLVLVVHSTAMATGEKSVSQQVAKPEALRLDNFCYRLTVGSNQVSNRGEKCRAHGIGTRVSEQAAAPHRSIVTITITSPSLKPSGLTAVNFSLSHDDNEPKFIKGVHIMDQFRTVALPPGSLKVPERVLIVYSESVETVSTFNTPDAQYMRQGADQILINSLNYEASSAVLTINRTVDLPPDPILADMFKKAGIAYGRQYVSGTLSLQLIPMWNKGKAYGPTTFEFGTELDWGGF